EAMARALFKSWFVDFDPVRKKQAGQPTGLPSEIDALFPGEFEDSALGEVPKGWWVGTIGDVADIVGGSTPSTSNPKFWVDGNHAWITPKDLSSANSIILMSSERKITDLGLKEITSGLLPQGSLVLSSRAPIGYLAINDMPVAINQGFIGMKPKPPFTSFFLLNWLKLNMSEVLSRANGSTFLEISKSNFRPSPFLIPPHSILNTFSQHTDPILSRLRNLAVQTRSLSVSRDTLLPKLISGELRVPGLSSPSGRIEGKDAERFVGGANV
ncbi:MAG: restriction endonuclease subunit S, partial [Leptospiraceae bacterium]|nr:restriction endonuclease subunit S [Leptospiraceae bacterium]